MRKGTKRGLCSCKNYLDLSLRFFSLNFVFLFISISFVFLFFLVFLPYDVSALNNVGSVYEDSSILDCSNGDDTNLTNSIVNHSIVECSDIDTSTIFYSTVRNSEIINMELNFANVIDHILVSGQIKYGSYTYYGPFRLSDIYSGVKPFTIGSLSTNTTSVKSGTSLMITYITSQLGYVVTVDASDIASGQTSVLMKDDGVSPDLVESDGVYTAIVTVDQTGTSTETLTADIDDNRGNNWQTTTDILLDNTDPTSTIYISDTIENQNSSDTSSIFVLLYLTYSDNDDVAYCRYGNSLALLSDSKYEVCSKNVPWYLTSINGLKTVYYEVTDIAGNSVTSSDTIILNMTEIPKPIVVDDGSFWGYSDRIRASWYVENGIDDSEATYEVRVYNSTTKDDTTNITDWIYTEDNNIEITGLNLNNGETYYIGVISYSGAVSDEAFSDGITIDITPPSALSLYSNIQDSVWTDSSSILFNFSSSDAQSGIVGYSYSLSSLISDSPDEILNYVGGDVGTVTYSSIQEGVYYFKVKGKNNASVWTDLENFTLYVDRTAPSKPKMVSPEVSGTGLVYFNWTNSYDSISGIDHYEIIISNKSDFSVVLVNTTTINNYYQYTTSVEQTYFAKVRASNGAGVLSLFSNEYEQEIDITPPKILFVTPQDYSMTSKVILKVLTDENARCQYKNNTDSGEYTEFYYTGELAHEQLLSLEDGQSYSFMIFCEDVMGNNVSTTISFTINENIKPSSIIFNVSSLDVYVNEKATLNFAFKSGSDGISNLDINKISVKLGNDYVRDYAILDQGSGNYQLIFTVPEISLSGSSSSQKLRIEYDNLKSSYITLSIKPLTLRVIYNSDLENNDLNRISYVNSNTYTLGLATNSEDYYLNSSLGKLVMDVNMGDGVTFIFFGKANVTDFSKRESLMEKKRFESQIKPSFGYYMGVSYLNQLILKYDGLSLTGRDFSPRGRYSFIIKNEGLTDDNKVEISVKVT